MVIFNAPCNPTGASYSRAQLKALADSFRATNTIVVHDQIYEDLRFTDDPPTSLAQDLPEKCIVMSGVSKALGGGGYRLGYMVFPEGLSGLRSAVTSIGSETYSCAPSVMQYAYAAVLKDHGGAVLEYQVRCRRILSALCKHSVGLLRAADIQCVSPGGAWYIFADFSAHRAALKAHEGITTAIGLCDALLQNAHVAILYDKAFEPVGDPEGPLIARISVVSFDGEKALKNVPEDKEEPIDDAWLEAYCPRVLVGIKRICAFVQVLRQVRTDERDDVRCSGHLMYCFVVFLASRGYVFKGGAMGGAMLPVLKCIIGRC